MYKRVADFHKTFGQLIGQIPQFPQQSVRDLRQKLLREESTEFYNAYQETDYIEMADGLADICYIIAGTCVSYGLRHDDFVSPYDNLSSVHKGMTLFYNLSPDKMVQQDFESYMKAEIANDLDLVRKELELMIWNVCAVAFHFRMPLNEIFTEVHRSNMAKALPDGTVRYREDGKVLKPDSWTPPDIKSILIKSNQYEETDDGKLRPKYVL